MKSINLFRLASVLCVFVLVNSNVNATESNVNPSTEVNTGTSVSYYAGSWKAAKQEARRTGKSIFVKMWADWCVNCRVMDENVFSDPNVSSFYNENFINYSLNYDSKEGQEFARTHDVQFLPDFFYFDSKANLVLRATDGKTQSQMLDLGYQALSTKGGTLYHTEKTASTTRHVGTYEENLNIYEAGYDRKPFLRNFAVQSKQLGKEYTTIANKFFVKARWSREDWSSPENQQFLFEFADVPNARSIKQVLKHKEALKESFGRFNVESRFKHGIRNYVLEASMKKNKKALRKSLKMVKQADLQNEGAFKHEIKLSYYENAKDWAKYASEMNNYAKNFEGLDPVKLNIAAWNIYNNSNNKRLLRKAMKWCKTSMAIAPKYYNHETYAHILHKLGKDRKAKSAVLRALVMANREGKVNTRAEVLAQDIDAKR